MRYALTLTALVAASSFSLSAQSAPPAASIRVGQSVTGRLVPTDRKFSDGSLYRMYLFAANKGDAVALDLTSDDFDANLLIADAAGNTLARNDDGGGSCNARLTFVPPVTGNYRVYANSSAAAELGDYRLTLAAGRSAVAADTVCRGFGRVAGMIEVGQTVSGELTSEDPEFNGDSTYFERWILPVRAKQTFTVDLESSDFDAYVLLTRGRGDKLVENDDGGGGCNARLVYTALDDHPLRIIVNSASRPRRQTGHFKLRVTQGELATEPKSNCRFTTGAAVGLAGMGAGATSLVHQASNVTEQRASAPAPVVRVGETINGRLTSSDSLYPDNSYVKYYQFTATPGQPITIDLSSDDFDPVLIIRGDDLDHSIIDDDGGPGCSARVSRVFPSSGPYRILVNTTTSPERQTGSFSLSITQGAKPVQQSGNADCRTRAASSGETPTARAIEIGQAREGTLTRNDVLLNSDSTYAQPWVIQGRAGQTITIDLESDDFDSYLFLRGPGITGGRDFQDDDSGGNCNARLTATFPQAGDYEIDVNTTDHYATGSFTLSVTMGSKPKSVARCNRRSQ